MKRVRITLEMDEQFLRLLSANVQLSQLPKRDELDASQVLALLVWYEARGAPMEQTYLGTPHIWRDNIEPVCAERRWCEDAERVAVGTNADWQATGVESAAPEAPRGD